MTVFVDIAMESGIVYRGDLFGDTWQWTCERQAANKNDNRIVDLQDLTDR